MSMYNLFEYSSNYSITAGSLWFYSRNKTTNFNAVIVKITAFKFFEYKTKVVEETMTQPEPNNNSAILKNATIVLSLKYLIYSKFWQTIAKLN